MIFFWLSVTFHRTKMLQNITDMVEPITEEYLPTKSTQQITNQPTWLYRRFKFRSALYWDWMETMTQALIVCGPPTLLVLGLVGNILSLLVMLRKAMRKTSVGIYCATLAVVDCLAAQSVLLDQMVRGVTGDAVRLHSWFRGMVFMFVTYFGGHTAAWIIVAISIDRFVSIWFPLQAKSWFTIFRVKVMVAAIVVTFVGFDGFHILFDGMNPILNDTSDLYLGINQEVTQYSNVTWYIIDAAIYIFIPAPVILGLNSLIIYRLVANRRKRATMLPPSTNMSAPPGRGNSEDRVYVMLIVVCGVLILSTLPHYILAIYSSFVAPSGVQSSIRYFLRQLFMSLWCVNHSVNFYLYCMTGRKFRRELMDMLKVGRRESRRDSRDESNNQSDAANVVSSYVASSTFNVSESGGIN